jgi:hypothetical protein
MDEEPLFKPGTAFMTVHPHRASQFVSRKGRVRISDLAIPMGLLAIAVLLGVAVTAPSTKRPAQDAASATVAQSVRQ